MAIQLQAASKIAELCVYLYEYSLLAGRVYAVHMHRNTRDKFSEWAKEVSEGELQF